MIKKVSRPFEYSGYSHPEYSGYAKSSEYISMFDGTRLALDLYLPTTGPENRLFPALLTYHPYHRANCDPKTGQVCFAWPGVEKFVSFFTSHGYVIVMVDMRGGGASYGSRLDMGPQLARDGKQVVDWIESQTWCSGSVGMFGGSYLGWSQAAVAGEKPRALKAIIPEVILFNMYSGGLYYSDGVFHGQRVKNWIGTILLDRNAYLPDLNPPLLPTAPVVDEDGGGDVGDDLPIFPEGKSDFLDDPPEYADGVERQHIYYNAVKEHLANYDVREWVPAAPFENSTIADTGYTWSDLCPGRRLKRLVESGIAVFSIGGWFDKFTRGTTIWYAKLKKTNPSRMMIHPSFHSLPTLGGIDRGVGPYWQYFNENFNEFVDGMLNEQLRFFDCYLKEIPNGIDTESSVLIYVMNGQGWRQEKEWPLARQVITPYYFGGGNSLSSDKVADGTDIYEAKLSHGSIFGDKKLTRWTKPVDIRPDQDPMKRTLEDPQCLAYTGDPLVEDTEITGHPIVHLWVSSTAAHGDFFVYLEDVDPTGEAYFVTDGRLKAGFQELPAGDAWLEEGALETLPGLPRRGYRNMDYVDGILADGKIIELVIDLYPTSWVFKQGHRIRVSIACADWPTFDLHPELSKSNDPNDPDNIVPTITVYREAGRHSWIDLPVIPHENRPINHAPLPRGKTADFRGRLAVEADCRFLNEPGSWARSLRSIE